MKRVTDPADPNRCKANFEQEQCWNEAEPGSSNCSAHGGRNKLIAESKRRYQLAEVEDRRRLSELSEAEDIKSLREEIGLIRMLIEKRMKVIKTEADLLTACGPLNSLFLTLDKLVKSCHTLEQSLGDLLSKQAVLRLGQALCEIVIEELQDVPGHEDIIDRIVDRLFPAIGSAQNAEVPRLTA